MNSKLLFYTFRTFPFIDELKRHGVEAFIFGSLKKDLERFTSLILEQRPGLIVGLARKQRGKTEFDSVAINRFNKKGRVSANGRELYELLIPYCCSETKQFSVSTRPSTSFCNWTMYSISKHLEDSCLPAKLLFVHIKEADISALLQSLREYPLAAPPS